MPILRNSVLLFASPYFNSGFHCCVMFSIVLIISSSVGYALISHLTQINLQLANSKIIKHLFFKKSVWMIHQAECTTTCLFGI